MRLVRGPKLLTALLLALGAKGAFAAALGSLATSLGVFAALAALFVIKGWPAHLPVAAFPSAVAALAVAGAVARLRRARLTLRGAVPSASVARRRPVSPRQPAPVELPAEVDRDALLAALRLHFIRLQDAWDRGDTSALERLATPDMLAELRHELPVMEATPPSGRTEIVTLAVELLGFERLGENLLISAEFSGLMRESAPERPPEPFRELWLLTQPKDAVGTFRLARHQALL